MLIIQANQTSAMFVTTGIFNITFLGFKQIPCNGCHDLLMMSMNLSDIAILNIKGSDYHCIISGISKNKAIKLVQSANLTKRTPLGKRTIRPLLVTCIMMIKLSHYI